MQRRQFLSRAILVAAKATIPNAANAEDEAAAVIQRFAATLSAHDMAGFGDLFADDYVNHRRALRRRRRRPENRRSRRR